MKKISIGLFLLAISMTLTAQKLVVTGRVITKDGAPLDGVAVTAVGFTNDGVRSADKSGYYELKSNVLRAGQVIELSAQKDKYIVVKIDNYELKDKGGSHKITIKNDPKISVDIVMQLENDYNNEIKAKATYSNEQIIKNISNLKKQLDASLLSQQNALKEDERRRHEATISKIKADIEQQAHIRDSVLNNVIANGLNELEEALNTRFQRTFQKSQSELMNEINNTVRNYATPFKLNDKSFYDKNKRSLIASENIKSIYDDKKLIISIDGLDYQKYANKKLFIRLCYGEKNPKILTAQGTGDNIPFKTHLEVVYEFTAVEEIKGDKIYLYVFDEHNKPQASETGKYLGIATAAIGGGGIGYGLYSLDQARNDKDYLTYKSKLNENDPAYTSGNRDDFYSKANAKYIKSQIIISVGIGFGILGTVWAVKKAKTTQQAKEAGLAFVPEKKRWIIEPLVSDKDGVGIRVKF